MHRTTVRDVKALAPVSGLPQHVDIHGPSPFGQSVWKSGGIGFRWEEGVPMQN